MGGVQDWVRLKLKSSKKSKSKAWDRTPGQLPFLPPHRPTALTTSPSHQGSDLISSPLDNYGLFGSLPYELRQPIITEAFSGRTLHIGLTFGHPLVRRPPANSVAEGEQVAKTHCGLGSELVPDKTQRPAWQWFGCVCHRRMEYTSREMERRRADCNWSRTIAPGEDECLQGRFCSCDLEEGTSDGADCFVGIMGWLLSCRQAYADAVDVLYSTNTFHFSDLELIQNLPLLLPQQHLSNITSLEMLWNFTTRAPYHNALDTLWDDPTRQDSPLHKVCTMVPRYLPHVRRLYISIQSSIDPPRMWVQGDSISYECVESVILGPVEDMLRSLEPGPGKEFNVAIQKGRWMDLRFKYHKLYGSKFKIELDETGAWGRFWKSLGCSSGQEGDHVDDFGYWICSGWNDLILCSFRLPDVL